MPRTSGIATCWACGSGRSARARAPLKKNAFRRSGHHFVARSPVRAQMIAFVTGGRLIRREVVRRRAGQRPAHEPLPDHRREGPAGHLDAAHEQRPRAVHVADPDAWRRGRACSRRTRRPCSRSSCRSCRHRDGRDRRPFPSRAAPPAAGSSVTRPGLPLVQTRWRVRALRNMISPSASGDPADRDRHRLAGRDLVRRRLAGPRSPASRRRWSSRAASRPACSPPSAIDGLAPTALPMPIE